MQVKLANSISAGNPRNTTTQNDSQYCYSKERILETGKSLHKHMHWDGLGQCQVLTTSTVEVRTSAIDKSNAKYSAIAGSLPSFEKVFLFT
mmetsp:Transcript_3560/g.22386  ORF Transcript_3560/g.22386 Transcript_3560/m.22386 type:complete len:91 (+) Transcript_3560:2403-2675(+)